MMEKTKEKFWSTLKQKFVSKGRILIFSLVPSFLIGLFCALSVLPFGLAPFGVAAACAGKNHGGVSAGIYCGAILGYLLGGTANLLYLVAVLLTIPLQVIFAALIKRSRRLKISLLSAFSALLVLYAISAARYGFLTFDIISGAAGIFCGVLFCYFVFNALNILFDGTLKQQGVALIENISLIVLLSFMLLPLCGYSLYGIVLARAAGTLIILLYAFYGNAAKGAVCAAVMMSALSIGSKEWLVFAAVSCVGAVGAGLFTGRKRMQAGVIYMIAITAVCFAYDSSLATLSAITEAAVGTSLFILLPAKAVQGIVDAFLISKDKPDIYEALRLRDLVQNKLTTAAASLENISVSLAEPADKQKYANIQSGINAVIEHTCKYCRLSAVCWNSAFTDTTDVFNHAAKLLEGRGYIDINDLPDFFRNRCINQDGIISRLNAMANEYALSTDRHSQTNQNRRILATQYASMGSFLSEISEELCAISKFDDVLASKIKQQLSAKINGDPDVVAYYDKGSALYVEIRLPSNCKADEDKLCEFISDLCSRRMMCSSHTNSDTAELLKYQQAPKYALNIAAAYKTKQGEQVCGDSFSSFKAARYRHILALSDGMGSGEDADKISSLTLTILQNLLKNGFSPDKACKLINTTLLLGGDGQSFSTLDLACIDLFTGIADFHKLGAAPTLIIRDGRVFEVLCKSVPVGIMSESKGEHKTCRLRCGDIIIMLSDGIDIDDKIVAICQSRTDRDLSVLCRAVLDSACRNTAVSDDMTVAAALVTRAQTGSKKNRKAVV